MYQAVLRNSKKPNPMQIKERNSAFELLRIVAMLLIVIWHISLHAQKGELYSHNYITAFCTTGVNLFILISGYFGIKISWKNVLTLISTILFYNIMAIAYEWGTTRIIPGIYSIRYLFAPFQESRWWFINCYFNLMLLSPIINLTLNKSTEQQIKYFIGVLLFVSCISGFCFGNSINPNGYNTFHFVTIYVLGNAIHRFDLPARLSTKELLVIYLLCTLILFICTFKIMYRSAFYNNPLVITSAVCLFCLIAKLNFKNKAVNYISSFMLPIYLIQDSVIGFMAYDYLYNKGKILNFEGWHYFMILGIYLLALIGTVFIADNIRRLLFNRPVDVISRFLKNRINLSITE